MSEKEDKAQKLKEIQDRLAEIQRKAPATEKKSEKGEVRKSPEPTSPAPKAEKKDPVEKIKTPEISEVKKPVSPSGPEKKITQEEKNWQANRLKKESKPVAAKKNVHEIKHAEKNKKKSSMGKIYTVVSLVITLCVISYFLYSFFQSIKIESDQAIESAIPAPIENEDIVNDEVMEDENHEEEAVIAKEIINNEEFKAEIAEETSDFEEKPPAPEKETRPKPPSIRAQSIIPTGIIISYSSNSTEKIAKKNVSELKRKGFNASYYFMPDKDANSPSLYKVYVGPYNDESAAMSDFRKIVDINDKAFILRMN